MGLHAALRCTARKVSTLRLCTAICIIYVTGVSKAPGQLGGQPKPRHSVLPDAQGHGPDPLRGQRWREGEWRRVHGPDTVRIRTRRWRHTWPRAQCSGLVCRHDEVV